MRVLFASSQGAGHYYPMVPFADACRRAGHELLFVVPPSLEPALEAAGYPYRIGAAPPPDELGAVWGRVGASSREESERLVLGEIFGRLNTIAMLPAMEAACDEFRPDLVLRELAEFSSAIAAARRGIAHARIGIGLAVMEGLSLGVAQPIVDGFEPGVTDAIRDSPYATVFPASLDPARFEPTVRVRDPAADARSAPLPDWWGGDDAPLVYVTFGSVAGGMPIAEAAYRTVFAALGELPVRVLLTIGRAASPADLGPAPANVHVEQWVPQSDVFGHAAAVVCHGGSGTTVGALAAGLPLVIVPMFADQPYNARRVAEIGAGVAVAPDPDEPEVAMRFLTPRDGGLIAEAVTAVLADPSYRQVAQAVAAEMRALPPVDAALPGLLE